NTSISFHSVLVERIEVFETSGKLVYANDSRLFPGVYPLVLGTKKGTYFIKIKTNNGVLIKKVLKL
ncbi:MAG: T9SS type A sorting domain-containing protein, partial [Bacteroidota bacterium]